MVYSRSEEHTSELQSLRHLVCRLLLEKNRGVPARVRVHACPPVWPSRRDRPCRRPRRGGGDRCAGGPGAVPARVRVLLFFFNDTATTEIYTLSLHDALPIWFGRKGGCRCGSHEPARRGGD